jgi:hypothetical protein
VPEALEAATYLDDLCPAIVSHEEKLANLLGKEGEYCVQRA